MNEYLLFVFANGSDWRKAGAANAMYWAQAPLVYSGDTKSFTFENATPESRELVLSLSDIWARKRNAELQDTSIYRGHRFYAV